MNSLENQDNSSLGKLLELHASIYNALTNPDLDVNVPHSPGPLDLRLASSFLLWQNLHLPDSVTRLIFAARSSGSPNSVRPLPLILLSEDESMVLVPLAKGLVMVFETDEESEGEELPEMPNKYGSCPQFNDDDSTLTEERPERKVALRLISSFIMPKISLSDSRNRYRLTIVTSDKSNMKSQTLKLMAFFRDAFGLLMQRIQISHLAVARAPLKLDVSMLQSSDLVFVVNDGTMAIPEVLLAATSCQKDLPKLTIINIITTNYFVNLVDIISAWRPFQIWKCPSLYSDAFLTRIKSFVEDELFDTSGGRYAKEFEAHQRKHHRGSPADDVVDSDALNASNSMYDSLVRPSKPNYKGIERQIRSELLMSQSFSNTDPLRLSSDAHSFAHIYRIAKALLGIQSCSDDLQIQRVGSSGSLASWVWSLVPSRNVWLICSFSMGLGVGVTVASGAATVFAVYFLDSAKAYSSIAWEKLFSKATGPHMPNSVVPEVKSLEKFADVIGENIVSWSHSVVDATMGMLDTKFVSDVLAWFNTSFQNVKSLSSIAMVAALNGLEKTIRLFSSVINIMP